MVVSIDELYRRYNQLTLTPNPSPYEGEGKHGDLCTYLLPTMMVFRLPDY